MRLKSIKLAGFKSFVDPTTVKFPSNLCAIVGPNGCGKSNIIDAVRWVMGESSAKNLRGESMADVIFNGSSARKPVGQASIELIFDNTNTRLTGDLAKYAEISIRRKVIRDGTSNYYLNGTKCRRRDITDIFLGTGLGPRSYAIIEQGMISRLIDAKPDELRVYVEEAAGISKYKERRRETENRIRHTRENLERLADIREELDKQLRTLKRQSEAAAKYKEYKKEERQLKAEVQAMQWRQLQQEADKQRESIGKTEVELEAGIARQRGIDADIETNREALSESNEAFNAIQSRFYGVGADIARLEQTIQHQKDRARQLSIDLEQAASSSEEIITGLNEDRQKLDSSIALLNQLNPDLSALKASESEARDSLKSAEKRMQDWQAEWDDFNTRSAKSAQAAEVEQSRIAHIEQAQGSLQQRIAKLQEEESSLQTGDDERALQSLDADLAAAELAVKTLTEENEALVGDIERRRVDIQARNESLNEVRSRLQAQRGKQASLEALQQAALGQTDNASADWLKSSGYEDARKLGENLQVEPGWEQAFETVLGNYLQAVTVPSIERYADEISGIESGHLVLLDGETREAQAAPIAAGNLAHKVTSNLDNQLAELLQGVRFADSLSDALRLRAGLAVGESVITREGLWLGRHWMRLAREESSERGVIARQAELEALAVEIEQNQQREEQLLHEMGEAGGALLELEQTLDTQQRKLADQAQVQGEVRARISAKRVRLEEFALRKERATAEIVENRGQLDAQGAELQTARQKLEQSLNEMAANDGQRSELLEKRDRLRGELERLRDDARSKQERHHTQAMKCQSLQSEISSLQQAIARMSVQADQLASRQSDLSTALKEAETPIQDHEQNLERKLQQRLDVENELTEARQRLENVEAELKTLQGQRAEADEQVQNLRSKLEQFRLESQALKVRQEGLIEQLAENQHDLQAVLSGLAEEAELPAWQEQLEKVGSRIQRLGAINLAAIEEYEQQQERKHYLDEQNAELESALDTLENAIRKIDRETRSRFKETFDQINAGLGELFPRVFGGGHAYLEMTGEDLLDTGVAIMARPPGKRNSTIHLLSGGEKALTAIALVFSIFRLKPAPFCMLDEVDAPLDDANVGRYARMVEEMSKSIQFIYISHNKIAMEMAKQLMGVTMHEAGVSRLVSVDVDEAVQLAAV